MKRRTDFETRASERIDRVNERDAQSERLFWRRNAAGWLRYMREPDCSLALFTMYAGAYANAVEGVKRHAVDAMRVRNYPR